MRRSVLPFQTKGAAVAPAPADLRHGVTKPRFPQLVVQFKAEAVDDEARTFEGLLSVWGLDLGDDVMHKGAFKATLQEWKKSSDAIPLLNSHNHYDVLSSFGQLIEAKETDDGLWTKWEVIPGPDGDRVLARIRPGSNGRSPVSKMSIGYEPTKFDFEQSERARFGRIRNLRAVNLKEGSLVLFPMAPGARIDVSSVKSFLDDANAADPMDVSPEAKAELRRLASRIGVLLSGKSAKSTNGSDPVPPAGSTEPGESGGDNPATPPASPTSTPAPETDSNEGKSTEPPYLFGDALQQRLLGLKISQVVNSTSRIEKP
jgi:HK97 family phage prohead protease